MSTSQTEIGLSLNVSAGGVVEVKAGVYWGASLRKLVGVKPVLREAATGTAQETVRTSPISVHKWASRVGMYNDDPIWAEITQNVRESRKRARKRSK